MHTDEVIVSHTNENEYNSFVNNKKNEALKDRMILIMQTPLQYQSGAEFK
jgi:serine protein kinase